MVAYDVYCLIEPKQDLLELVRQSFPEFFEYASCKHVWKMRYGGLRGPTRSERDIAIKLMFLAEFRSITITIYREPSRYEAFLEAVTGTPPFGENIFDRWWTFEHSRSHGEFEEHLYNISLDQLRLIAKTGLQRVDDWIEDLQEMKENGEI